MPERVSTEELEVCSNSANRPSARPFRKLAKPTTGFDCSAIPNILEAKHAESVTDDCDELLKLSGSIIRTTKSKIPNS